MFSLSNYNIDEAILRKILECFNVTQLFYVCMFAPILRYLFCVYVCVFVCVSVSVCRENV